MLSTAESRIHIAEPKCQLKSSLFQQQGFFSTPGKNVVQPMLKIRNVTTPYSASNTAKTTTHSNNESIVSCTNSVDKKQSQELVVDHANQDKYSTLTTTTDSTETNGDLKEISPTQRDTITVNGRMFKFIRKLPTTESSTVNTSIVHVGKQPTKQSDSTLLSVQQSCTNITIDQYKQAEQNTCLNKKNDDYGYENLDDQVLMVDSIKQINVLTIDTKETNHRDQVNNSSMESLKHQFKVVLRSPVDYMALNTQEKTDELDEPNSKVNNLQVNIKVNELNQQQMILNDSKEGAEKINDEKDDQTTALYENSNVNKVEENFSRESIITTTPPSTTSTTPTTNQGFSSNNKPSFHTSQSLSVSEQYIVVKDNHHIKSQFTDSSDDDSIHINIINSPPASPTSLISSCTVYLRRHSVSTGDLLDIVRRRSEFGESQLGIGDYKLSLSCNDVDQEYSLEDIRSFSEESVASHADDEQESEGAENLHDPKSKKRGESGVVQRKTLRRQKAIRRAFKKNERLSISVDAPSGTSKATLYSCGADRRHGIATLPTRGKKSSRNNVNNNDFVNGLAEFKRSHKKQKFGLFFARSVENLKKSTKKKRKSFLESIFSSKGEEKMEHLRETCILDDDIDDEILSVNFSNGFHNDNSNNSHVCDDVTNKRVASIIEMYHDKNGEEIRKIEIIKVPSENLGFFIRFGNGIDRTGGIFISRVTLDSLVDKNNLLHAGDEILQVNKIDVTGHTLEQVAAIMQTTERLIIKTRSTVPLPAHENPLLKYSFNNQNPWDTDLTIGGAGSDSNHPQVNGETNSSQRNGEETENKSILRTWSEPSHLGEQKNAAENELSARERSTSYSEQPKKYQRCLSQQNNTSKSPVYGRKLPPIPDGQIQDFMSEELHSKGFSRAQKYQSVQKSLHEVIEENNNTHHQQQRSSSPRSPIFMKSPRIFKKEKKHSNGSMLSIPSSDSLSSMSDSEESIKSLTPEKLQVYNSDGNFRKSSTKGFTGKLTVAIYKLIGRLSGLDANCYCTIEIDDEFKATTQLHRIKELVSVDESFDIDIQDAHVLTFFIFHKQTKRQDKLVSQACIVLENLLSQQNNSKLMLSTTNHVQMRVKINFTEVASYIHRSPSERSKGVFGFQLSQTLVKEENTIPIIVRKCVEEIEKRGLKLTGIYRISGSARKKKLLRQQFEENSMNTDVSNPDEVDCHVLAGILKDYLRELPKPLISDEMYHNIYNKGQVKNKHQNNLLEELMKKLPYANRATLIYIMDHLKKVASYSEENKMNFQNLAVCFGPVMMSTPEGGTTNMTDMLDFKKQIDALEFLLSIWPVNVELQNHI